MNDVTKMPGMPGMDSSPKSPVVEKPQDELTHGDSPAINVAELTIPSHDEKPEEKAIIEDLDENNSVIQLPKNPKKGIEVVATRRGFYRQHRKKLGDKFTIAKFSQLGEWMSCVDPVIEKERLEFFKKKKAK